MRTIRATREFFKIEITCWSCGASLIARAENVGYNEDVGEMKPDEFGYDIRCGRCLVVTTVPSGLIPQHVCEAARKRYINNEREPLADLKRSERTFWFQPSNIWKLLRGKRVFVHLEPIGEGPGMLHHTFRP